MTEQLESALEIAQLGGMENNATRPVILIVSKEYANVNRVTVRNAPLVIMERSAVSSVVLTAMSLSAIAQMGHVMDARQVGMGMHAMSDVVEIVKMTSVLRKRLTA